MARGTEVAGRIENVVPAPAQFRERLTAHAEARHDADTHDIERESQRPRPSENPEKKPGVHEAGFDSTTRAAVRAVAPLCRARTDWPLATKRNAASRSRRSHAICCCNEF